MVRCPYCKAYHSGENCPLYLRAQSITRSKTTELKQDFYGQAPAPFVGHYGYPRINVGILSPGSDVENAWEYDAPSHWARENYSIGKIMGFRTALVNSRFKTYIKSKRKMLEIAQEVGMASKPVDVEVNLKKQPAWNLSVSAYSLPMGPRAEMKKGKITSNPFVSRKVEKVVDDTDLKSAEALTYLYKRGFQDNFLTQLLSVGNLGIGKNRKLVPTRWSITATDDTLGKFLIDKIKDYSTADYSIFFDGFQGNYFLVMVFPGVWSYELFEINVSSMNYTTDHEFFNGRKNYAEETAGGYYACRMGVLEGLARMKRQGRVVVVRFITPEYTLPLGVFVVREAVRKAMREKVDEFDSRENVLQYALNFAKERFKISIGHILAKSKVLKEIKEQTHLRQFF